MASFTRPAEQGKGVFVKLCIGLAKRVQSDDGILELGIWFTLYSLAFAIDAVNIIAANILRRLWRGIAGWAKIDPFTDLTIAIGRGWIIEANFPVKSTRAIRFQITTVILTLPNRAL